MNREEKIKLAIEKGISYNPTTGQIFGVRGKEITNIGSQGYVQIMMKSNDKFYNLSGHQFAWYWVHKECVECLDHRNQIRNDNRISNLRSVSNQENSFNSKGKGYYYDKKNNKWRAQIMINRKSIKLGRFNTEDEAKEAYRIAKEKLHDQ